MIQHPGLISEEGGIHNVLLIYSKHEAILHPQFYIKLLQLVLLPRLDQPALVLYYELVLFDIIFAVNAQAVNSGIVDNDV